MIIFIADGRLGNQLFQLAFLKTIAKKKEFVLIFGMKELNGIFDISEKKYFLFFINKKLHLIIKKIIKPYFLKLLVKFRFFSYITENKNTIIYNKKKGFSPIVLVESNYFQSEKFFDKDKIDFRLKNHLIEEAIKIINSLDNDYTKVFIHIRRGDFLTIIDYSSRGLELPKSYYTMTIDKIGGMVVNPFFIFLSDDPDYVEREFGSISNKYVSRNSIGVDFALITLCEYGIMANSTFSWWGAYFIKNKQKIYFPKYWSGWKEKVNSHIGIDPNWAETIEVE